jgi:hypothetical protein
MQCRSSMGVNTAYNLAIIVVYRLEILYKNPYITALKMKLVQSVHRKGARGFLS